jgi:hypothetical protein
MRAGERSEGVYTICSADSWPNHTTPGYSHFRAAGEFSKVPKGVGRLVAHRLRKTLPLRGGARTAGIASERTVDFCLKTPSAPCPTFGQSSGEELLPLSEALSSRHPSTGQ